MSEMYSRGQVKVSLTINSGDLTKVARNLQIAVNGIYGIEVISLLSGADKEDYDNANKAVNEQIAALGEIIEKRMTNIESQIDENNIDVVIEYSNPLKMDLNISSPTSIKLIDLFKKADHLAMAYDKLWFAGMLNAEQRTSLIGDVMSALRSTTGFLINANNKSKAAIAEKKNEEVVENADA